MNFVWLGVLSAFCYLAKTALLSRAIVSFAIVLILLCRRRQGVLRPAAIMIGCAPLIAGILQWKHMLVVC